MPDAVIGLIGLPRSGTTLIHRTIASHDKVDGLIEPYHGKKQSDYQVTDLAQFMVDHQIDDDPDRALVVKETLTRPKNAHMLTGLLKSARDHNVHTGLVLILRCPFQAFLSQVEAHETLWKTPRAFGRTEASIKSFALNTSRGSRIMCENIQAPYFRVVHYGQFCQSPTEETARMMAMIPLQFQRFQLDQRLKKGERRQGDPKTYQRGSDISETKRTDDVNRLIAEFPDATGMAFLLGLQGLVKASAEGMPDRMFLDRLTEFCYLGRDV